MYILYIFYNIERYLEGYLEKKCLEMPRDNLGGDLGGNL